MDQEGPSHEPQHVTGGERDMDQALDCSDSDSDEEMLDEFNSSMFGRRSSPPCRRKEELLSLPRIEADLTVPCGCGHNCASLLDPHIVLRWRHTIHDLPAGFYRHQRLFEIYKTTLLSDGRRQTTHVVEGIVVCRQTWYSQVLGISSSTYKRIRRKVNSGLQSLVHEPVRKKPGDRGEIAIGFMTHFVHANGEPSPESGRILLPLGITLRYIYDKYADSHKESVIKEPHFRRLWKENFPHVSRQKYCKLSKCGTCMLSRQVLENTTGLPDEVVRAVKADREEHLTRQQTERRSYYTRRAEAISEPDLKTSLIIDGMDQSKTNLPHFKGWVTPKECTGAHLLQTHVTGVLVHGKTTFSLIDINQYPHDSNLTLSCLLRALLRTSQENRLTPVLYVQADNCGRENKNRYFLSFMALLVARGIVKEVLVSFLMVGHTHEDVDAKFSKISKQLRLKHAKTVPELLNVIEESTQLPMSAQVFTCVFNIRDWMLPCLEELHNHTSPHVFRLFVDRPGHVALTTKMWSTDAEWQPSPDQDPLELFKLDAEGNQILPTGTPEIVRPVFDLRQQYDDIKRNIEKMRPFLAHDQHEWWQKHLQDPEATFSTTDEWTLDQLLPLQPVTPPVTNANFESPLQMSMERERTGREVYSGKKKKKRQQIQTPTKRQKQLRQQVGYMLAVEEDGELFVGKVTTLGITTLGVTLFTGTLGGCWEQIVTQSGNCFSKTFLKENIKEDMVFYLTSSGKLPANMKDRLKKYVS